MGGKQTVIHMGHVKITHKEAHMNEQRDADGCFERPARKEGPTHTLTDDYYNCTQRPFALPGAMAAGIASRYKTGPRLAKRVPLGHRHQAATDAVTEPSKQSAKERERTDRGW